MYKENKQRTGNKMGDDVWKEVVTKRLLAEFGGRAKFRQLKQMLYRNHLLDDMGLVFKRLSDSSTFLVFKKDGEIACVSVYRKDVRICRAFREQSCETCIYENCLKYHVCTFFVSGNCRHSTACHYGHDIQSKANKKVSDRLGLSSFSAEEILAIISRSHPSVCVKYNVEGCDDDDCPDLHVCSPFILQKCTAGDRCMLEHTLQSPGHNKWVLDMFEVGSLTEDKMRKRIMVNDVCHTKCALRSPAASSLNVTSSSTVTSSTSFPPQYTKKYTSEVFSFLLKRFGGRAEFGSFLTERGVLLAIYSRNEIVQWFKDNSDRFLLFERGLTVEHVSVYNRHAKLCLRYNSSHACHYQSCNHFHVCRDFVAGTCASTSTCGLSHSFFYGRNAKICKDLKLCQFTDDDIRQLVLCSNPAVCVDHNGYASGCEVKGCPDLHVCSKYIVNLCTDGDGCRRGHTIKDSEHNIYVLNLFRVRSLKEKVLRELVIVKREHRTRLSPGHDANKGTSSTEPPTAAAERVDSSVATPSTPPDRTALLDDKAAKTDQGPVLFAKLATDVDPDKYKYLCEEYTWTGTCRSTPDCPRYHAPGRAPYLWMILCRGKWYTFSYSDSLHLEKSFCLCISKLTIKISVDSHRSDLFRVDLNCMVATAFVDDCIERVKVVRLSTPSYVMAAPPSPLTFYTQWLWYRKGRFRLFTPLHSGTLQYTLEEKYLKGQHKYISDYEDYRLIVDTRLWTLLRTNGHTQEAEQLVRRPFFVPADKSGPPRMSLSLLDKAPLPLLHQVPEHWAAVDRFQDFELVELNSADSEYDTVQRQFYSTMNVNEQEIKYIFRVQNPGLWDKYCSARRAMTPRGQVPEDVEERQLFHGTPTLQAARGICANSFDFRRAGENSGTTLGKGSYFSTKADISHCFTTMMMSFGPSGVVFLDRQRFMFLGRVLVGQYTWGHPSYTKPPVRDWLKMYDSCVDDVTNPTCFVIFDLAQSYPEYLIQYIDKRNFMFVQ